jgi:hypothetical protein
MLQGKFLALRYVGVVDESRLAGRKMTEMPKTRKHSGDESQKTSVLAGNEQLVDPEASTQQRIQPRPQQQPQSSISSYPLPQGYSSEMLVSRSEMPFMVILGVIVGQINCVLLPRVRARITMKGISDRLTSISEE